MCRRDSREVKQREKEVETGWQVLETGQGSQD